MSDDPSSAAPAPWTLLARGAGRWIGDESMPAPGTPGGLSTRGRLSARLAFEGRGLVTDYVQEGPGDARNEALVVLRWDGARSVFVMHFFDAGGVPMVLEGRAEGDTLTLQGPGPGGPMRQSIRYGEGLMEVRSEVPGAEGAWVTVFEARYRPEPPTPGSVGWRDLTVADATGVRDFYRAVVGWGHEEVSMGDYADYAMTDAAGEMVAGVCHARGPNTGIPPQWLLYVTVADLDASLQAVAAHGGAVLVPVRTAGGGRMAVVQDPAGAALALFQS